MDKKQMVVPLALVAMLWSTLFRAPFANVTAGGRTSTASASKTPTPNKSAATPQPSEEDHLDTFDVLAESLGVDISTEGLKRRANRAVRTLRSRSDDARAVQTLCSPREDARAVQTLHLRSDDAAVAHAASYLSAFFDLPTKDLGGW